MTTLVKNTLIYIFIFTHNWLLINKISVWIHLFVDYFEIFCNFDIMPTAEQVTSIYTVENLPSVKSQLLSNVFENADINPTLYSSDIYVLARTFKLVNTIGGMTKRVFVHVWLSQWAFVFVTETLSWLLDMFFLVLPLVWNQSNQLFHCLWNQVLRRQAFPTHENGYLKKLISKWVNEIKCPTVNQSRWNDLWAKLIHNLIMIKVDYFQ